MGRYRLDPVTGELDHAHAVEALASRLRKALGDWTKNEAFGGDPLAILRDALIVTLGPSTLHAVERHITHPNNSENEKQNDE